MISGLQERSNAMAVWQVNYVERGVRLKTALEKLGHEEIATDGFRSTFKTRAMEDTDLPTLEIECALAHEPISEAIRCWRNTVRS